MGPWLRLSSHLTKRQQAQVRLEPADIAALVDAYQAGNTLQEIAFEFGVHVQTAAAHLKRQGVPQRRHRLTDEQVTEAVHLYEAGWSLAKIGEPFGVWGQSVGYRLRSAGVTPRDSHGRKRT